MFLEQRTQQQQKTIPKTHGIHLDMAPQQPIAQAQPVNSGTSNARDGHEGPLLPLSPHQQTPWPGRSQGMGGLGLGDRDRELSGSGDGSGSGTNGGVAEGIAQMEGGTGCGDQRVGAGAGDGAEQHRQQPLHESGSSLPNNACIEEFFIGPEVGACKNVVPSFPKSQYRPRGV